MTSTTPPESGACSTRNGRVVSVGEGRVGDVQAWNAVANASTSPVSIRPPPRDPIGRDHIRGLVVEAPLDRSDLRQHGVIGQCGIAGAVLGHEAKRAVVLHAAKLAAQIAAPVRETRHRRSTPRSSGGGSRRPRAGRPIPHPLDLVAESLPGRACSPGAVRATARQDSTRVTQSKRVRARVSGSRDRGLPPSRR